MDGSRRGVASSLRRRPFQNQEQGFRWPGGAGRCRGPALGQCRAGFEYPGERVYSCHCPVKRRSALQGCNRPSNSRVEGASIPHVSPVGFRGHGSSHRDICVPLGPLESPGGGSAPRGRFSWRIQVPGDGRHPQRFGFCDCAAKQSPPRPPSNTRAMARKPRGPGGRAPALAVGFCKSLFRGRDFWLLVHRARNRRSAARKELAMGYSGHSNVRRTRMGGSDGDLSLDFGLGFLRFALFFAGVGPAGEVCGGGSTAWGLGPEGVASGGGGAEGIGKSRAAGGLPALRGVPAGGCPCGIGRSTEVQNKRGGSAASACEAPGASNGVGVDAGVPVVAAGGWASSMQTKKMRFFGGAGIGGFGSEDDDAGFLDWLKGQGIGLTPCEVCSCKWGQYGGHGCSVWEAMLWAKLW